jgi:hypothetical protein
LIHLLEEFTAALVGRGNATKSKEGKPKELQVSYVDWEGEISKRKRRIRSYGSKHQRM